MGGGGCLVGEDGCEVGSEVKSGGGSGGGGDAVAGQGRGGGGGLNDSAAVKNPLFWCCGVQGDPWTNLRFHGLIELSP